MLRVPFKDFMLNIPHKWPHLGQPDKGNSLLCTEGILQRFLYLSKAHN